MIYNHFINKSDRTKQRLVTTLGLLALYGIGTTAYILTLPPKIKFLNRTQQHTLERAIVLESQLKEAAGLGEASTDFAVSFRQDETDAKKTQVYVERTSSRYPYITLEDVYTEHYHAAEMRNGDLYVIRRLANDGTQDELWQYDISGQGKKLHSSAGLDFRASPAGSFIGITEESAVVVLLNQRDGTSRRIRFPELTGENSQAMEQLVRDIGGLPAISLLAWSDDETMLWGSLDIGPTPILYFRITPETGAVKAFGIHQTDFGAEVVLNPNTGEVLYSNYPQFFDVEDAREFSNSAEVIALKIYSLINQTDQPVATSLAKAFEPLWLDDNTVEYNDPSSALRIVHTVERK